MAQKTLSYTETQIVITDDKNKSEKIDLLDFIPDAEAIFAIRKEQKAGQKASIGALTLLVHMLDNPRFDAYKGQTPAGEKITPEFRGALRDIEIEYMKPLFVADLTGKGNSAATAEKQWQEYSLGLRQGTYAMVKSYVSKLFCHLGQLPKTEQGKLLPINAIKTILANVEAPKQSTGIAGKLVSIAADIDARTEKTEMGDIPSAIAALKSILATYEGLYREQLETLTQLHSDGVMVTAQEAIAKAATPTIQSVDSIQAQYDNGGIDETTYQILMLDHGIKIEFEDAPM